MLIKKLTLRIITACLAFLPVLETGAQEGLRPLSANLSRMSEERDGVHAPKMEMAAARSMTAAVQLPFRDDFFYAHSTTYPARHLWADSLVNVNTGYPIAPPSLGVATFDGLNKHGYPYEPNLANLNSSRPADTLTSKDINLRVAGTQTLLPSDSIGLVFYYQVRGYGDNPDPSDSLIVDLYNPTDTSWKKRVWFQVGNANSNTIDTVFRRVFIRIDDPDYFKENFRFRFRNTATTAGDFDHWHVDYVQLDKGLYPTEPDHDDITFAYVPTSLLGEYSAMPWRQYRPAHMSNLMNVWIKNNSSLVRYIEYKHTVYDPSNSAVFNYDGGAGNLYPFADSGYSDVQLHARIDVGQQYQFAAMPDSMDYKIEHVLSRAQGGTSDFFPRNDTVLQYQRFRNYYAYDDGSAEAAYYVNGTGAMMAVRVQLNQPDTFRAMRIYFDPVGRMTEADNYNFRIQVWSAATNGPGPVQYSISTPFSQNFEKTGFKLFPEYELEAPIILQAGTYYFGIQQQGTSTVTVGFDRNYDNRTAMYYNYGAGWNQTSQKGSLMIRPVFGQKRFPVGITEQNKTDLLFRIYPNPSADHFTIDADEDNTHNFIVSDALGAKQLQGSCSGRTTVSTSSLSAGLYFVTLINEEGGSATQKLLIAR